MAGAEDAAEAIGLVAAAQAPARHCLHHRVQRPRQRDQADAGEHDVPPALGRDRDRGQPHERQVAQVLQHLAPGARRVDGIEGGKQFRQPVAEEQRGHQRPGFASDQRRAVAEAAPGQHRQARERAEAEHGFRGPDRGPQRDEGEHHPRRPAEDRVVSG